MVSKIWIFLNGNIVDNILKLDMVEWNVLRWILFEIFINFNLILNRVDDDDFGMYICIVVFKNDKIKVVWWGLNVDGVDFSKLLEIYRKNVIIGGIVVVCLFVVFVVLCVIWYCCYSLCCEKD